GGPALLRVRRALRAARALIDANPDCGVTTRAMQEQGALREEFERLAAAARERRSVDAFLRAALEGFAWIVLAGVCGKLFWDSLRPPLFFWPLALLDALLLWDSVRNYRQARADLQRELRLQARGRALRRDV